MSQSQTSLGVTGAKNEHYKLLKTLKKRLTKDGGSFVAMSRLFKKMDLDGNGVVDFEEFTYAVEQMEMMISAEKVQMLFNYFDIDGSGSIDVNEFIKGVREPIFEDRIMANKITCSYEPVRLASGMKSSIDLYLSAEIAGVVQCDLKLVIASINKEVSFCVKGYVVPQNIYKAVHKQLEMLHNNPELSMLNENVREIGKVVTSFGER